MTLSIAWAEGDGKMISMIRRRSTLALFLLLTPTLALAQGRRPSIPAAPPAYLENSEKFAYRGFEDDRGGFYVIWTHQQESAWSLLAQHIDASGRLLWGTVGLKVADDIRAVENWDAVADGKGGFLVGWVDSKGLRAQRITPEGKTLWPEGLSVTTSTRSVVTPHAVADVAGGGYLVWSEKQFADRWVLFSQRLGPDGTLPWGQEGLRVSLRPSDQRFPHVVFDGQSGFIAIWKDSRESASQVQASRMDFQGNRLWGPEGIVITAPAGSASSPSMIEPIGGGSAVIGWLGSDREVSKLFLQSVEPAGKLRWDPQGILLSYGNAGQWNPVLYGDGKGTLWSGWEDFRDHSHWQVYVGRLDAEAHQSWQGGEVPMAIVPSDQSRSALTDDGKGGIFGAWLDNRSGRVEIFAQNLDVEGRRLLGEKGTPVLSGLFKPLPPRLISLSPGNAAMVVADRQNKNRWALYWATVSSPAPASPNP